MINESDNDNEVLGLKEYIDLILEHDFSRLNSTPSFQQIFLRNDRGFFNSLKMLAQEYRDSLLRAEEILAGLAVAKERAEELFVETKKQEESLRKSRGLYSAIITNMGDALLVIDRDRKIISFNSALASMFMLDPGFFIKENCPGLILGMDIKAVFGTEIVALVNDIFDLYADQSSVKTEGEPPVFSEISLGGGRTGKAVATPMFIKPSSDASDKILESTAKIFSGAVITIRDTTREKETESMKADFIRLMSHALKTPLTSVIGFAEIAYKKFTESIVPLIDAEDKKIKKTAGQIESNLKIIAEEGRNLASLIGDVLDIAKIESGRAEWKNESFPIKPLIEYSIKLTSSIFKQKGLNIETKIEENLPEAFGDRDRYAQVIMSIISNAAKYSSEGTVTVGAGYCESGILITVADQGAGVEKEKALKLFEKFRPMHGTFSDDSQGTGLSLHMCGYIIEHYGGKIWVESENVKGSVFRFTVPAGHAPHTKQAL